MEKTKVSNKTKPIAADQPSSVSMNSKSPIMSLKTTTENNIDDFLYTSPIFKTVISTTNQNKKSSFNRDSNDISNPDIETKIETPCLSLASENKCETPKILVIDTFIDKLTEGNETVVAADSQTDDSIRIILPKDIESRSLQSIDVLRFDGDRSK